MAGAAERSPARQVRRHRRARGRPRRLARTGPSRRSAGWPARQVRLLVDHRDASSPATRLQSRIRWHLHEIAPELEIPTRGLKSSSTSSNGAWLALDGRCAFASPARSSDASASSPDDQGTRTRDRQLVDAIAPQLLTEPGCGALTAAKLVGEIAGAATLRHRVQDRTPAGIAPIPASSGNTKRYRLDRGGNRQINAACIAQRHPDARQAASSRLHRRRRAEGKTTREAIRCLKRYLARHIWRSSTCLISTKEHRHHHQFLDIEATLGSACCWARASRRKRHSLRGGTGISATQPSRVRGWPECRRRAAVAGIAGCPGQLARAGEVEFQRALADRSGACLRW